ncbi:MAG TPA: hypothetical protein VNL71_18505 [Chloroflexota bacterium]|nr:hypothetical protein [Chloroflexota bacterium]
MSFDRPTRNLLSTVVGKIRERLKTGVMDELRRLGFQDDGAVLDLHGIGGLTEQERAAGADLRALLAHLTTAERGADGAGARGRGEREAAQAAYDRMAREIGFTTLNRLTTLRMAEERGLIVQSVGAGLASSGFQIYERVTNGALGSRHDTYRAYLECLYDETARDLPALFDRADPHSRIFPGERCLEDVLALLNAPNLAHLWKEDETIGWIYQYYNDPDERKKMRESQAPRTSRELAVRNQFFTPRYVVEFLTDNTLGRTWYEMRQGNTQLKEQCRYLVRRYDEVFLSRITSPDQEYFAEATVTAAKVLQEGTEATFPPFTADWESVQRLVELAHCVNGYTRHPFEDLLDGEWWPVTMKARMAEADDLDSFTTQDILDVLFADVRADRFTQGGRLDQDEMFIRLGNETRRRALIARRDDLSQQELLRQPVFIPYRAPKDPRDLKILDPACGSGHFLLYAFDLLTTIYEEAWAWDAAPRSEATRATLRADYPDLETLRRAVPALILAHNPGPFNCRGWTGKGGHGVRSPH